MANDDGDMLVWGSDEELECIELVGLRMGIWLLLERDETEVGVDTLEKEFD